MKNFFKGVALITAALILFPAIPYAVGIVFPDEAEAVPAMADAAAFSPVESVGEVSVYDSVTGRTFELTAREYVAATLAAILPPNADPEVLKAQAVLMYTYVLRRREEERASPTPSLMGCDVGTDTDKYPRLALGDDLRFDFETFRDVAEEVAGEYCSYAGEPISVAYCYSAGTSTESAETVLGTDIPYLRATPTGEPDAYFTTVTYTADEVFARLGTADSGYVLLGDASGWITPNETAPSGYVLSVKLDSRFIVSGAELSRLLNLPSSRFTFRYSPATERFTFTVSGSGSLVGMSQRGAAALAAQGYNYKEILLHFFDGIDILTTGEEPVSP